jgi:hypothetical protein
MLDRSMTLAPRRNAQAFAHLFNLVITNENDLIGQDGSGVRIQQAARFDDGHLCGYGHRGEQQSRNREEMNSHLALLH